MSTQTTDAIVDKLSNAKLADELQDIVLAALEGDEALRSHLQSTDRQPRALPTPATTSQSKVRPNEAYLTRITVEGFRGIGEARSIDLQPGNGLTLVEGRNGAGKSSFAEGIEALLVGSSTRWDNRTADWKKGWRNLHHPTARVSADFTVPGSQPALLRRTWANDAEFAASQLEVQISGAKVDRPDAMGWEQALDTFRPFLSYNDLSRSFDKPSELYDIVNKLLGLDELTPIAESLKAARKPLDETSKRLDAARAALVTAVDASTDPRAADLRTALGAKRGKENLTALNALITEVPDAGQPTSLRHLLALTAPDLTEVQRLRDTIAELHARTASLDATNADRSLALAALVEQALQHHEHAAANGGNGTTTGTATDTTTATATDSSTCPVCLTPAVLTDAWRAEAQQRVTDIRTRTKEHADLRNAEQTNQKQLQFLCQPPAQLGQPAPQAQELVDSVSAAWNAFQHATTHLATDTASTAFDELVRTHTAVHTNLEALQQHVAATIEETDTAWRPVRDALIALLGAYEPGMRADTDSKLIKKASEWFTQAGNELRNERFAVIRNEVMQHWEQLRLSSAVSLTEMALGGSNNSRHVQLDVKVDDKESVALSVVSQGELHALALSIFLPRPLRPESPFRFLIIDDPVQAMDPARVEGLARLLDTVAQQRQVIVFTHDNRLADALRKLDIHHSLLQLTRATGSKVRVEVKTTPWDEAISRARRIAGDQNLPDVIKRRVVGGFLRQGVEAAAHRSFVERRLRDGAHPDAIEEEFANAKKLVPRVALARGCEDGELYKRLNNDGIAGGVSALQALNSGSHGALDGDLRDMVNATNRLVEAIRNFNGKPNQ